MTMYAIVCDYDKELMYFSFDPSGGGWSSAKYAQAFSLNRAIKVVEHIKMSPNLTSPKMKNVRYQLYPGAKLEIRPDIYQ